MIDQRHLDSSFDDALTGTLIELLANDSLRQTMSTAMLQLARPDAAWKVALMIYDLACQTAARRAA